MEDNSHNEKINFKQSLTNRITKKLLALHLDYESRVTDFNRSQLSKNRTIKRGPLSISINGKYVSKQITCTTEIKNSLTWNPDKVSVFKENLGFLLSQAEIMVSDNKEIVLPKQEVEERKALLKSLKGKLKKEMKKGASLEQAIKIVAKKCDITQKVVKEHANFKITKK